jgi:endonuclease/exonuclease/phosphatase family metal-dependent hydrolase
MRTITYNIYMCRGYPKETVEQLKNVSIVDLLPETLGKNEPDIITFSEMPSESVARGIAQRLGMQAVFFSSPEHCHGALLTRFEVLEIRNCPLSGGERPEDLFTRHWGRAVLNTGEEELIIHSAHLYPDSSSSMHRQEVNEVIRVIREDMKSGRAVLLQGDLNHEPKDPAYPKWIAAGLVDTFAKAGIGPAETCRPSDRPAQQDQPNQRIDYIFAYGPIIGHLCESQVLNNFPFRISPSDRKPWSLSDHLPVMATFEG